MNTLPLLGKDGREQRNPESIPKEAGLIMREQLWEHVRVTNPKAYKARDHLDDVIDESLGLTEEFPQWEYLNKEQRAELTDHLKTTQEQLNIATRALRANNPATNRNIRILLIIMGVVIVAFYLMSYP